MALGVNTPVCVKIKSIIQWLAGSHQLLVTLFIVYFVHGGYVYTAQDVQ